MFTFAMFENSFLLIFLLDVAYVACWLCSKIETPILIPTTKHWFVDLFNQVCETAIDEN